MDGEIVLIYTLEKRNHVVNSMMELVQSVNHEESNAQRVQTCYDILTKGPSKDIKFYVNNNSMVGHMLKGLLTGNKQFVMKCRNANTIETQSLPVSSEQVKVVDSFKNAVLYSQLNFLGEGEHALKMD